MVGPKPAFTFKEIFEELINFEIYSNGSLKKKKDVVWTEICNRLNYKKPLLKIQPLNLYIKVKKDSGNLLSDYRRHKNLPNENIIVDKEADDNADSDPCDIGFDKAKHKPIKEKKNSQKKNITFKITFDQNEWKEISPIEKVYKNGKKGHVLKPGWPDVVVKKMWLEKKLPCTYNFKRHVIDDTDSYIKIEGYCNTCNARLKINCEEKPSVTSESINFIITTTNTRGIPHLSKRRLAGPHREKVKDELKTKKPKQWQRDLAAVDMVHGDSEPPFLYALPVLQKASQEIKNEALGITPGTKLFDSLSKIKEDPNFNKFIREIGYNKFYTTFWSPEQISVHNQIQKLLNHPICFDATASVTLKIDRPGGESSDIYLSVIVSHVNNIIVPLTQAISERNDTNFLTFWLSDWRKSGAKVPSQIITDMGKGLQNSAALAFNNITFTTYNDLCLLILLKKQDSNIKIFKLSTYIRTDVAHLLHAVSKWPCFSKCSPRVKDLYMRCTGFMTIIDD